MLTGSLGMVEEVAGLFARVWVCVCAHVCLLNRREETERKRTNGQLCYSKFRPPLYPFAALQDICFVGLACKSESGSVWHSGTCGD